MTWICLRKRNFYVEIVCLLIAAKSNAIRTNNVKIKKLIKCNGITSARKLIIVLIKKDEKETGVCRSSETQNENERKGNEKNTWIFLESWKKWNLKVTVIPVVVGAHGMDHKGLEKRIREEEIRGRIKTIQTIALLKSECFKECWRVEETCCCSDFSEKTTN